MLLTPAQQIQLRGIWDDPRFQVVFEFLDSYKKILREASAIGDTEFETLKLTLQKEFQIILINEIKRLLEQEAANAGAKDD